MPGDSILQSLRSVRRRLRVLTATLGIGVVGVSALLLLVGAVALDYLLNLPAVPRVVVLAGALVALVFVAVRYLVRPAVRPPSLRDIAARLEAVFPEFDDRLRSSVDFLAGGVPGSAMMQRRVLEQTEEMTGTRDLGSAVVARPAFAWASALGLGAVLVALLAMAIGPAYRGAAIARILEPFGGHAWPKSVEILMDGELPARVAAGQRVDLRMRLAKGDRASMRAVVRYQYDEGPIQQELMTRGPDGAYVAQLDAHVDEPKTSGVIRASISAGDDEVVLPAVSVVPRLTVKSVQAVVAPPAYVHDRTTSTFDLGAGALGVVAGSDVALRVTFSKPLARDGAAVVLEPVEDSKAILAKWALESDALAVGHLLAERPVRFRIRGTDVDGLDSDAAEEYELAVRPDAPPTIQIDEPRRNEMRTAVGRLKVAATAEDDLGIKWVKMQVDRVGERDVSATAGGAARPAHWEIPLVRDGTACDAAARWAVVDSSPLHRRYHLDYGWELAGLPGAELRAGDVLEYRLLAQDEFVLNGKEREPAHSAALRVTIISQDELSSIVGAELSAIAQKILEVKQAQERTRQDTESLAADTRGKARLDASDRVAGQRLTGEQTSEASGANELQTRAAEVGEMLDENRSPAKDLKDLAAEAAQTLGRVAEGPMNQAAGAISEATSDEAGASKNAAQREGALGLATDQQRKAEEDLSALLARMNDVSSLQQAIDRLAAIQADQLDVAGKTAEIGRANVGKSPDQMAAGDRKKLEAAADAQAKLGDRTAAAIAQMSKAAQQLAPTDKAAADAMQQAAEEGQNQQVPTNQSAAAQAARQNQQAAAQAAQQAAEIGLESMIAQLREAQRHKLEELSRKLADMQEQVGILVRRQAGHNLDNLIAQGSARLAAVGKVVGELAELAQRVPPATQPSAGMVPATAPSDSAGLAADRQAEPQALTERNTRDLAKAAAALPEGAEPSSRLVRAAGRMERAVVPLRELKLAEAYDPSQVEALAALEAAKKAIDDQKNKVDQQLLNSQKEALRQRYVQVRLDQQRIATDVPHIDQSRGADGTLPRIGQVRLAQLPAEQQGIAQKVEALQPDLSSLDSIVFSWANRELSREMEAAKEQLARQETGTATQQRQDQILGAIDDIIASLKVKPIESAFAQDQGGGGGGGGGGGSKPMPTEAELRMLKALQLGLNRATVDADNVEATPRRDSDLLELGTRQGDLRHLLNELLDKASRGSFVLGPEPDNRDQLPEEAKAADADDKDLDAQLLSGKPDADPAEQEAGLVGTRMSRSRQRMALNHDGGEVTQAVQKQIVKDLDSLIEQARQRQAQARNSNQQGKPQQEPAPADSQAKAENQGQSGQSQQKAGSTPARTDQAGGPAGQSAQLSADIKQSLAEWGQVTPRLRQAMVDGSGESVVEPYRKIIEDYYKSLATKSSGH